jgi:peroxiredoxin
MALEAVTTSSVARKFEAMSSRFNANTVLLSVFILILVGAGVDYGRKVLGKPKPEEIPHIKMGKEMEPTFKAGELAPDFALPDSKKKVHKLSEIVKSKSVLFFACGCNNCREVQTLLAAIRDRKKSDVPSVITVTSAAPESEEAWIRDTGLPQTMLFWSAGVSPDPMAIYKGKPCPRVYVLNPDRTVKFIGPSPNDVPSMQAIGMKVAQELGTHLPKDPKAIQRIMDKKPPLPPLPEGTPNLPPYAQPQSNLPGA